MAIGATAAGIASANGIASATERLNMGRVWLYLFIYLFIIVETKDVEGISVSFCYTFFSNSSLT